MMWLMKQTGRLLWIYWPFAAAIVIEILAYQRALTDSDAPKDYCYTEPRQLAVYVALIGVLIAIAGLVRIFLDFKSRRHIVAGVVLLLLVVFGSFMAGFVLNFMATWCF